MKPITKPVDNNDKKELTEQLKAIRDQYENISPLESSDNALQDFSDCLNHANLKAHLMETEIAPDDEEADYMAPRLQTVQDIINEYQDMYDILEDMGLVEKIEDELQELN